MSFLSLYMGAKMEKSLFKNILGTLSKHRSQFLFSLLLIMISNALSILNPLIFRHAILAISSPSNVTTVWHWASLLVCVACTAAFLKYRMRIGFITISRDAVTDLRA